jgi:hypothetical protein
MEGRRKVPVLSVRAGASGALEVPVVGAMQKIRRREVQKVRGWQRPKIASVGWRCRWPGWVSTAKKSRIKRMAWVACPWGIQCLGLSTRGGWCSCGARHISILRCVRVAAIATFGARPARAAAPKLPTRLHSPPPQHLNGLRRVAQTKECVRRLPSCCCMALSVSNGLKREFNRQKFNRLPSC